MLLREPVLPRLAAEHPVVFLGGKGGVGKTTLASATALGAARDGRSVLVVSTDPAHNLGHLWEREVGDRRVPLTEGLAGRLDGIEIDPARTTDRHLAEVGRTLRRLMPEHLAGEVDRHLELSRGAPGTHEAAVLERMTELLEEGRAAYDLVVLDTAPSGHTARLLALPEIMTAWTDGLLRRRESSERFGEAIRGLDGERGGRDADREERGGRDGSREQRAGAAARPEDGAGGRPRRWWRRPARETGPGESDRHAASILGSTVPPDPLRAQDAEIRSVLLRRRDRLAGLRDLLTDPAACSFAIVLAAERLPVLESVELHAELTGLGVDVGGLVVNKRSPADRGPFLAARRAVEDEHLAELARALPGVPVQEVPLGERDVVGAAAVEEVAEALRTG